MKKTLAAIYWESRVLDLQQRIERIAPDAMQGKAGAAARMAELSDKLSAAVRELRALQPQAEEDNGQIPR